MSHKEEVIGEFQTLDRLLRKMPSIMGTFCCILRWKVEQNLDRVLGVLVCQLCEKLLLQEFDFVLAHQRDSCMVIGEILLHPPFKEQRLFFVVCGCVHFVVGSQGEEEKRSVQSFRSGCQCGFVLGDVPCFSLGFIFYEFYNYSLGKILLSCGVGVFPMVLVFLFFFYAHVFSHFFSQ